VLPESLLHAVSFTPRSLKFPNAWVGHLPFAAWVMKELRPGTFVELGTHSGNSFFSFCQAVAEAGLPTRCYAVDTWKGDEHANHYSEAVFAEVSRHHHEHYAAFARLLRTTFDDAVRYFDDASVDLLHIDGLHTYEAVRYDFETWLPKLSPGAVVLFHDTNVRERNFGVWRLWLELEQAYPHHLEFVHSHGLGVLQLNDPPGGKALPWLVPGSPEQELVLRFFAAMSDWHLRRYDLVELGQEAARLNAAVGDLQAQLATINAVAASRDQKIAELHQGLVSRDQEIARRDHDLARLQRRLAPYTALRDSRAWHLIGPPARLARRAVRRLRGQASPPPPPAAAPAGPDFSWIFDPQWYLETNPDVRAAGADPLEHFNTSGWREGRKPHPLFDPKWYLDAYPDVRNAGVNPLEHYVQFGAAELRNPGPGFDAAAYVARHPEAAPNPLRHHLAHGGGAGASPAPAPAASPSRAIDVRECLPGAPRPPRPPVDVTVDVIVPVYKGLEETKRCLESVLADPDRPPGVVRVIDDCSPDAALSDWLAGLAASGRIELTRNDVNRGFVASVNLGMAKAAPHDVVLLNSDTEVPGGFLRRLVGHAFGSPRVATVTPFSNYAGEMCSYPSETGGPLPAGYTTAQLDQACRTANDQRAVEIPVGRGFCLYIRRPCLDEIGPFDEQAFGRGYGEETDFCLRARQAGWRHLLACDTFVYHAGQVSFGAIAPERDRSWHTLVERHPDLPALLRQQLALAPTTPLAFAATAALFRASGRPTILAVAHGFDPVGSDTAGAAASPESDANLLRLSRTRDGLDLSVPSLAGHPVMHLPADGLGAVLVYARACGVSRAEVQHWVGLGVELRLFLQQLGTPVDMTVHEYAMG